MTVANSFVLSVRSKVKVTYGQVWLPILGICALQLTHPKCTHTAVNTHLEQWAAINVAAPGEVVIGEQHTLECNN